MERIKLNIQKFGDSNTVEVELIAIAEELEKSMTSAMKSIDNLKKTVKGAKDEAGGFKSVAKDIKNAFSGIDFAGAFNSIKKLGNSLYSNFLSKAIDTSEELNLFNVVFDNIEKNGETAFSELGKHAIKFQNKLNEAFGTNRKETMRYQGLFQSMGESSGLSEEVANLMSENMTKLSYDLASLYNTTETKAAESLRAGVYAGQTKPLRNYGIDVTQTSFKPIMTELGLDKSVNELTQAEKEVLRYISTLRQAQNAMGDFANTIESPANQLKILKQQFFEMQAAIGNLFVGAFARILPYVNGIIMAIKEVAKAIASLFGIKMKDYNTGIASYAEDLDDYSEGLGGIADSAGGASDAIKALKRQTLGFDQINNLTSPTPSSGGGGGSGGGAGGGILDGIDSRLLDALKGYENGMDRVKLKAAEIRDKIMDVLGFTKHINRETGEVYFTYDGWKETLKGVWGWFKELNPVAKIFAGIGIPAIFLTLFNVLKKISDKTGVTAVLKGIFDISKKLLTPLGNLTTQMTDFAKEAITSAGGLKNLKDGLSMGINSWREQEGIIKKGTNSLNGFKGVVAGTKNVLLGLGEAAIGVKTLNASVIDLKTNGENLGNVMGIVGGTFATVFGGVQAGAVFGPWGAAIGGVAGAIVSLGTILQDVNVELMKDIEEVNSVTKKNDEYFSSLQKTNDEIDSYYGKQVSVSRYHKSLLDELKAITDVNGKVKDGYEERAQFITTTLSAAYDIEIDYQDGIIQNYQDIVTSVDDAISTEERYAKLKGLKEKFEKNKGSFLDTINALESQDKAYKDSFDNLGDAVKDYNDWVKEGEKHPLNALIDAKSIKSNFDKATDSFNTSKETMKKGYDELLNQMLTNNMYQRVSVAETQEEIDKIMNESKVNQIEALTETMIGQAKVLTDFSPEIVYQWKALAISSENDYKLAISKLPDDTATQIQLLTGKIVDATPGVVQHFIDLGRKSESDLVKELKALPKDVQTEIVDKMKEKGEKIPEEIQKGINKKKKPKADVETSSKDEVQQKVNNSLQGVSGSVNVGVNLPNSWEVQQRLNNITGVVKAVFGIKANGGVYANGHWQPVQAYANGGVPAGGQLFMAREAGPELVGKIGRHTAVMNNNQIVDSVKAGVYEAVSAAMSNGGIGAVQIDLHTDEGVVVDRINKITRQTGTCPIDI